VGVYRIVQNCPQVETQAHEGKASEEMTVYDISSPYDLRTEFEKLSISTGEIETFPADPDANPDIKDKLLRDLRQQGYTPASGGDE
jgi:hypothetical protein